MSSSLSRPQALSLNALARSVPSVSACAGHHACLLHSTRTRNPTPVPSCSGHIAVLVNEAHLVVYGGLRDKTFLHDSVVLDIGELRPVTSEPLERPILLHYPLSGLPHEHYCNAATLT